VLALIWLHVRGKKFHGTRIMQKHFLCNRFSPFARNG
jgi:hypothetical protein